MNKNFQEKMYVASVFFEDGKFNSNRKCVLKSFNKAADIGDICISSEYLDVGDVVNLTCSLEKLVTGKINFLHHFDRPNKGDVKSGPYNYFNFPDHKKISWDKSILKSGSSDFVPGDVLIHGGGIYFTRGKPRLDKIIAQSKYFIGWGIGLDPRIDDDDFTKKYHLLGTRERKSNLIDNKRVFYVPCASCMDSVFDSKGKATQDIIVHLNGGFNEREIVKKFGEYSSTKTTSSFEELIANIQSSNIVVTNSYHGAYWGSLLGKKVVCYVTNVPKWDGLHENVVRVKSVNEIEGAIKSAVNVPSEYLEECRSINKDFYQKVLNLVG